MLLSVAVRARCCPVCCTWNNWPLTSLIVGCALHCMCKMNMADLHDLRYSGYQLHCTKYMHSDRPFIQLCDIIYTFSRSLGGLDSSINPRIHDVDDVIHLAWQGWREWRAAARKPTRIPVVSMLNEKEIWNFPFVLRTAVVASTNGPERRAAHATPLCGLGCDAPIRTFILALILTHSLAGMSWKNFSVDQPATSDSWHFSWITRGENCRL